MIPLIDLSAQYKSIKNEIGSTVLTIMESGQYILGNVVQQFEQSIAEYLGVKHAVGVASGTDALILSLRAINAGNGDEIIVPAYTFFATASAVMSVGAKPVFVDIDPKTYQIDTEKIIAQINTRTKAIIPVHLYGHPANMKPVMDIANKYGLKVIEDNAQAFGAEYFGQKTGAIGDIGCLSFFPTKNLGAFGDGGMVITNDDTIAERVRMLRTHGWKKKYHSEEIGYNSRLDALQAGILSVKLPNLEHWNSRRMELATIYNNSLPASNLITPISQPHCKHVYHLYIIRSTKRNDLQKHLKSNNIASDIYYPLPPHLAVPFQKLGYKKNDFPEAEKASMETLAIPLFPEMTEKQQEYIITTINSFFY